MVRRGTVLPTLPSLKRTATRVADENLIPLPSAAHSYLSSWWGVCWWRQMTGSPEHSPSCLLKAILTLTLMCTIFSLKKTMLPTVTSPWRPLLYLQLPDNVASYARQCDFKYDFECSNCRYNTARITWKCIVNCSVRHYSFYCLRTWLQIMWFRIFANRSICWLMWFNIMISNEALNTRLWSYKFSYCPIIYCSNCLHFFVSYYCLMIIQGQNGFKYCTMWFKKRLSISLNTHQWNYKWSYFQIIYFRSSLEWTSTVRYCSFNCSIYHSFNKSAI